MEELGTCHSLATLEGYLARYVTLSPFPHGPTNSMSRILIVVLWISGIVR